MPEVLVIPRHPEDPEKEAVATLVNALELALPSASVRRSERQPAGHGVSPWEVVSVVLSKALEAAELAALVAARVAWLRSRHARDKRRPKRLAIYGPDGEPVKWLQIEGDATEVSEGDDHRK